MALNHELGKKGEELAAEYLSLQGYTVLFINWRHWRYEIDLIAHRSGILHIVEVKTRSSTRFGLPEEDVNRKKLNSVIKAAEQFMQQYPEWKRVQFDVLSITISKEKTDFLLIEDVYL